MYFGSCGLAADSKCDWLAVAGGFFFSGVDAWPLVPFQMMNKVFGGTVHRKSMREDGVFNIGLDNTCSLFRYSRFHICSTSVFILVHFSKLGAVQVLPSDTCRQEALCLI